MTKSVPVGLEMESRYADSYAWRCPECGAFNNISRTACKRRKCGYKRKKAGKNK